MKSNFNLTMFLNIPFIFLYKSILLLESISFIFCLIICNSIIYVISKFLFLLIIGPIFYFSKYDIFCTVPEWFLIIFSHKTTPSCKSTFYFSVIVRRSLYLSDIPLHDATRDLVLMSEQFEADYKLTRNLELLTDKLQQTYRELDGEKQKTDR